MQEISTSYVHGASNVSLIGDTVGQHFDKACHRWSEREALVVVQQDIRWSYAELKQQVDDFAAGLISLDLAVGDRVGIWSPNNAEWVVTQFATAKLGLVLVNINPAYRLAELEYALNKVECKALVTAVSFKTSEYVEMLKQLAPEIAASPAGALKSEELPHLRSIITLGDSGESGLFTFAQIMERANDEKRAQAEEISSRLQFDEPINIQFTSGTTGMPKGATLTHHNILNNGFFIGESLRLTSADRICIPVPLYHCFGMVLGNLACVTHGAAMIYPAEAFEPLSVLRTVEQEKCTGLYGVPTMFIAELEHADFKQFDMSTLRTGIMAGSPCPIEVMKRVVNEMSMTDVTIAYGMTETSPVSFMTSTDDPLERKVATIGRVHPHVEVKIVNNEGRTVAPGEAGELCTRGYSVMLGYWNDKEKTAEAIDAARWMHTGDLATLDAQGYCNIVGRIKDMVIRGGENIYPREIEEYLYRHEKIGDVQVIGVPDEKYGEELCAWIKTRDGESLTAQEVQEFCKGQIAHYKIPRYIRFVDEFPMTVTGKVKKFVMRETMIAELGLAEEKGTA